MSSVPTAEIYVITCSVNGRVYVGSAKRATQRLKHHWQALIAGRHENSFLQRAWVKYGAESFSHRIVEKCVLEDRWQREQWWIDHLKACNREHGFNVMHSVQGLLPSPAMSKILKKYWKARWEDPEYREQRTEQLKGLSDKPGVRERMSISKIASWKDPEYRRIQSEKHKEYAAKNKSKMSDAAKSLWDDPAYRAKQMVERKARFADPAFRAKLSAARKRYFANKALSKSTPDEIV